MEIHVATDAVEMDELDDDRDQLLEIHEILERLDDSETAELADEIYQRRRHDLCADCFRKFVKNPVGAETAPVQLDFSKN
jgi:hypothetical protein